MPRRSIAGSVALAAVVLAAAACGTSGGPSTGEVLGDDIGRAPPAAVDETALVKGLTDFGFDLLPVLTKDANDENTIFSPLSIGMAFGMAEAGARGETADQIAEVFHFPEQGAGLDAAFNALDQELSSSGKATVRLANRMYPATGYEIHADFTKTLAASFGAPLERLDFAADSEGARERINEWVSERTEKRIPELFTQGSVTPNTVLVLVNALYLKADWLEVFGEYPTETAPFSTLDGSTTDVKLMHNGAFDTRYVDADGLQAVELPYEEKVSMLVLVPEEGGLGDLEQSLDAKRLAAIDAEMTEGSVDLFLPKWSAESDIDLDEALGKLGLTLPFDGGDFTGISPDNPPLTAAIHAANIDVDEWGTVAAAATGLAYQVSGPPPPDVVIRADRPFLYLIRDVETGTVLFLGRVVAP